MGRAIQGYFYVSERITFRDLVGASASRDDTDKLSVDEKFSMRTPKVTKKFRFLYNKGVVHDDGTITSFYN